MYNVVNKKCTLNYLSTQCKVQLTVQYTDQKSVKYSAFKGVQGGFICLRLFRVTFTVQMKVQYKGKY